MKKTLIVLVLLTFVVCNVFAADFETQTEESIKKVTKLLFIVGIVVCMIGIMFLAISSALGITVSDKLRVGIMRAVLAAVILSVSTLVPAWIGVSGVTGGLDGTISLTLPS